jgi:hypothetical protein
MIAQHVQHSAATNVVTPDFQDSSDCTKLIRKLRWIGLEGEANRLQEALRTFEPGGRDTVSGRAGQHGLTQPRC